MLKLLFEIIFYALALVFTLYSVTMVYVLVRFGQSRTLSLALSALYVILALMLFAAAQGNFTNINFPSF